MNQTFGKFLLFLFLLSAAAFNIARGRKQIRSRRESTFWGWARVVLGVFLALVPFFVLWLLWGE